VILRNIRLVVVYIGVSLLAGLASRGGPEAARHAFAWLYLVVAPSLALALSRGRGRGRSRLFLDDLPIGFAENLGIFSALALVLECAAGGLSMLLLVHPLVVAAFVAARVGWAGQGERVSAARTESASSGIPSADPTRTPSARVASGRRLAIAGIALCLGIAAIAIWRPRPPDYRLDVYDHVGAAARVAARNHIFSRELGNGEAGAYPDPRKGTWNALLAGIVRLSGAEPLAMWRSATAIAALFGVLAYARLAREFIGAAWPLAWLVLLLAPDGGPGGEWFSRSAYPGSIGLFLYALFLAECLAARREGRRLPILLALALPLVHHFAGALALAALATLVLVSTSDAPPPSVRSRLAAFAAIAPLAAVVVAVSAWRVLAAGALANPIQVETQGVLALPGGLLVPEPMTVYEFMWIGGVLGLLLAPLLWGRARTDLGAKWVLLLVASLVILVSPPVVTLLAGPLGYLLRRLPALVPFPLIISWVLIDSFSMLAARRWRPSRLVLAVGGIVAFALVAQWCGRAAALVGRPAADERASVRSEAAWTEALERLRSAIPPAARVATDPLTSYVLYARTLAAPVALPDQHSPPNDVDEPQRLRDLARILSPWTSAEERDAVLAARGITHVIVNEGIGETVRTFGYVTRPENLGFLRAFLDADTSGFDAIATSGPLRLYAVRSPAVDAPRPPTPVNPTLAPSAAAGPSIVTESGIGIAMVRTDPSRLAPGEVVTVECTLSATSDSPPIGNYLAFLALTRIEGHADRASRKIARRIERLMGKPPDRVLAEREITGGLYPVLLWRENERIAERLGIRVPNNAPAGRYRVTLNIVRLPVFANRRLVALLTDRDEYAAFTVDTVEVVR